MPVHIPDDGFIGVFKTPGVEIRSVCGGGFVSISDPTSDGVGSELRGMPRPINLKCRENMLIQNMLSNMKKMF